MIEKYTTEIDGVFSMRLALAIEHLRNESNKQAHKTLLSVYYSILRKHFHVFGYRLEWEDAREDKYFNRSYVYNPELTFMENLDANTEYDKTFYVYDNVDYTQYLDTIDNERG